MASKFTTLGTAGTAPADGDYLLYVDVSDTTMAATGTTKKLPARYLARTDGDAVTITGGGTLALGGYTLTVAATGTMAADDHTHVMADITDLSVTTNLGSLTDVAITTPADNEVLAYDSSSGDWINQTAAEAGLAEASHTHTESDITDLGSYLESVAINDVTDVAITTPADNEVLAYDSGSGDWINQTAAEAGLAEASHTHTESDITDLGPYEPALGNPASDGYVLSSTAAGTRSWVEQASGAPSSIYSLLRNPLDASVTSTSYTTITPSTFIYEADCVPTGGTVHLAAVMKAHSTETCYVQVEGGYGELSSTSTSYEYNESSDIKSSLSDGTLYSLQTKSSSGGADNAVGGAWLVYKA